ncbi:hypothetical protein SAMN05444339_102495 [Loktanella atrilutea]|uniref:Transposase n=1 Tax=Loktanella atrilutea TaxID=366533 RepID=A0A1M4XIR2_LOKAT|nr:hypothetical protein SAMN05444339_102495 [Loktanella atrilutea]
MTGFSHGSEFCEQLSRKLYVYRSYVLRFGRSALAPGRKTLAEADKPSFHK